LVTVGLLHRTLMGRCQWNKLLRAGGEEHDGHPLGIVAKEGDIFNILIETVGK